MHLSNKLIHEYYAWKEALVISHNFLQLNTEKHDQDKEKILP